MGAAGSKLQQQQQQQQTETDSRDINGVECTGLRYGGVRESMMIVKGVIIILYMRGITSLEVR